MSSVITVGSDVECPDHGVAAMASSARLTVGGKNVVVKSDLLAATISGCTQPTSQSSTPCLTVTTLTSGEAAKLTVGGQAVLLDSLAAVSSGLPKNQLTCKDARQTRLTTR